MHHETETPVAADAVPTILCERKVLLAGLAFLDRSVIERRNTIPVLSGVLFTPMGDDPDGVPFAISGTDLDMEARLELPGLFTSGRPFVAASAKALHDAVKACTADEILMELIDGKLRVSGGATVTLATLPPDDMPAMAKGEHLAAFEIDGYQLAADLARVSPAISTEETRYYLNGVYLHTGRSRPVYAGEEEEALRAELRTLDALQRDGQKAAAEGGEDQPDPEEAEAREARMRELQSAIAELEAPRFAPDILKFAATDGHRLMVQNRALPEGAADCPNVILPRKLVAAVLKLLGKAKPLPKSSAGIIAAGKAGTLAPDVRFYVSPSKVRLQIGRWSITSKVIDGTFPDYTRVIPTANDRVLALRSGDMASGATNAAAVANERTRAVRLDIDAGKVIFTCSSPENGTGRAEAVASFGTVGSYETGEDGVARPITGEEPATELTIGFNATYLASTCASFGDGAALQVSLADAAAPTLFTSPDVPGFLAVLMPMRVCGDAPADPRDKTAVGSGLPPEAPRDRFIRVYTAAWGNRDKAGLTRASGDYLAAMISRDMAPAQAHATVAYEAAVIRREAADSLAEAEPHGRASWRAEARLRAIDCAGRGQVTRKVRSGGILSAGNFRRLSETETAIRQLASLPGFDPADTRTVLPVTFTAGGTGFVLAADLRNVASPCMARTDAKGVPTRKRRESNLVFRHGIAGILPPKLDATETAARLMRAEADNAAMRAQLDRLEALVADLAARPAAVAVPAEPEPVIAPEPEAPAPQLEAEPTVLGSIIADLAAKLEDAQRRLARYERQRPATAKRMRWLRASERMACRQVDAARTAQANAESEAEEAAGRATALAGRLQTAEAELARLQPLALAISALAQPQPAPVPPPVNDAGDAPETVPAAEAVAA